MSLFVCSECGTIDNSALGNFHKAQAEGKLPVCSACDPMIGKWHDRFPRRYAKVVTAAIVFAVDMLDESGNSPDETTPEVLRRYKASHSKGRIQKP